MKRVLFSALAAAAALSLTACATPTPYQPLETKAAVRGGYSDYRISSDHFRVSFQGNTVTDRDTVERYLLYRAAELTRDQGYDWFALADRDTERQTRTYTFNDDPFGYGAWRPTWYYLGRGQWVIIHEPDPFYWGRSYSQHQVDQYRASAEIVIGKGPKPAGDAKAFDAREVLANLGPTIRRPEAAA